MTCSDILLLTIFFSFPEVNGDLEISLRIEETPSPTLVALVDRSQPTSNSNKRMLSCVKW